MLVLALVAALVVVVLPRATKNTVTVDFERTVSLYEGSKVRILGVDVGTVEKITPRGEHRARASSPGTPTYDVPADVQALSSSRRRSSATASSS